LVVALARDLQQEFYPHYSELVHHLIALLDTKDSDVLEWTFTCLAYLSKFLWRYLVKDVGIVFRDLLPLLEDSRPDYINNFAAESFAFVARKVKDKKAFLLLVLKTLKKHPEVSTYYFYFSLVVFQIKINLCHVSKQHCK
jgi:U3 small nucleolar RNA-associated protein 20